VSYDQPGCCIGKTSNAAISRHRRSRAAARYRAMVAGITQCLLEQLRAHQRPADILLTVIALAAS